jgi:hypothetical protein
VQLWDGDQSVFGAFGTDDAGKHFGGVDLANVWGGQG